jgi:hypothetical protein
MPEISDDSSDIILPYAPDEVGTKVKKESIPVKERDTTKCGRWGLNPGETIAYRTGAQNKEEKD